VQAERTIPPAPPHRPPAERSHRAVGFFAGKSATRWLRLPSPSGARARRPTILVAA
jgi:hypothetical protein